MANNNGKCVTRCETSAFTRILGHLVPIEKFTGLQFPTNSQILERYFLLEIIHQESKNEEKLLTRFMMKWIQFTVKCLV